MECTMDNTDKTTCLQSWLYCLSFVFPWELTFHGRYKPAVILQLKASFWEVRVTLHCSLCPASAELWCVHPACCAFVVLVMSVLQTMQYLIQWLKQPKENSESIESRMTYSEVQCNLKYILWNKLHVGLMSMITSSEVLYPPHSSLSCCVRQERDGCCHALCV